jgi:hypothetical protein
MNTYTFTALAVIARLFWIPAVQVSLTVATNLYNNQHIFATQSRYRVIRRRVHHRKKGYSNRFNKNADITYYPVIASTSCNPSATFVSKRGRFVWTGRAVGQDTAAK